MEKGYLATINKKVLVVTTVANDAEKDPDNVALRVFTGIRSMLKESDLDIAVVKVPVGSGFVTKNGSYVYARDRNGQWSRLEDRSLVDSIIRAGI